MTRQLVTRYARPPLASGDASSPALWRQGIRFRRETCRPYLACLATLLAAALATPRCGRAATAPPRGAARTPAAQATQEGLLTLTGKLPEIPDKVPQAADYQLKLEDEKFYLCVPPNYRGTEPFGLLVFIHAADEMGLPPDWKPLLAKRKLLYIAPQRVGNGHFNNRRVGMAIVAICKMMETYRIDPKRVYVTGLSGGARIACLTAFIHPNLVSGVLPMCGAEFPGVVPKKLATRDDPYGAFQGDPKLVEKAKANVGFALISGPKDFRHGNILDIYNGGYAPQKYRAKVFDVPGMGHEMAPARVLDMALDWLERGRDQGKLTKEADGQKPEEPTAPKKKSEPAAEAKGHPLRTWTDSSGNRT